MSGNKEVRNQLRKCTESLQQFEEILAKKEEIKLNEKYEESLLQIHG